MRLKYEPASEPLRGVPWSFGRPGEYQELPKGHGFVFKAHRLVYHSTLGLRVIKKKKEGVGV